jgi:hypothetical protein
VVPCIGGVVRSRLLLGGPSFVCGGLQCACIRHAMPWVGQNCRSASMHVAAAAARWEGNGDDDEEEEVRTRRFLAGFSSGARGFSCATHDTTRHARYTLAITDTTTAARPCVPHVSCVSCARSRVVSCLYFVELPL